MLTVTVLLAVKSTTVVPVWFVFGESEICAVWMPASGIPWPLIAAITAVILVAFAARACRAVFSVVETPKLNWAWSGTLVTMPVP